MKKLLSLAAALVLLCSTLTVGAFAADAKNSATVKVNIANAGKLEMAQQSIVVTDADKDGKLTIYDALFAAHEKSYPGGAAAGFAAANTEYGLSLTRLWGVDTTGVGYYLNNASAWSLADTVKDGDCLTAWIYQDIETWSDVYSYFDLNTVDLDLEKENEVELQLSAIRFTENYEPLVELLPEIEITVNGEKTAYKTDIDGKVKLQFTKAGSYVISATSKELTLVPPACVVTATTAASNGPEETGSGDSKGSDTGSGSANAADNTAKKSPKTGYTGEAVVCLAAAVLSLGSMGVLAKSKKNWNED